MSGFRHGKPSVFSTAGSAPFPIAFESVSFAMSESAYFVITARSASSMPTPSQTCPSLTWI
uniref:Uncharacterized protein n=1 Tax=Kalanchoe fedtschenkoi TaxID=63787 RepID=A0A7N0TF13_KALFE